MLMKNTKKKGNPAKKLIPAAGSLMVSAVMLATSTYAWFTMNKEVEVKGMEVRTKVGDNLLISTTNLDADYTSLTLNQSRKALLEPVSSINGATETFYYTTNAKANGDAVEDVYVKYDETENAYNANSAPNGYTANADAKAGKNSYMNAFNTAYGQTVNTSNDFGIAYGYVDYTFYIKATSSAANQKVVMSECDLSYTVNDADAALSTTGDVGKVGGPDRAWRVAVFADDITATAPGTGAVNTEYPGSTSFITVAGKQKGLIALANAENQTANKAVTSTSSAAGDVVNNASDNGVVIGTIAQSGATAYYKVVVRLWLEGEDKTCTSETYAKLTDSYKLDMEYKIVDSTDTTTAVKAISNNDFVDTDTTFNGAQYDTTPANP
jgi:hypothetical protein